MNLHYIKNLKKQEKEIYPNSNAHKYVCKSSIFSDLSLQCGIHKANNFFILFQNLKKHIS